MMAATRGSEFRGSIFSRFPWSELPLYKLPYFLRKLNDSGENPALAVPLTEIQHFSFMYVRKIALCYLLSDFEAED